MADMAQQPPKQHDQKALLEALVKFAKLINISDQMAATSAGLMKRTEQGFRRLRSDESLTAQPVYLSFAFPPTEGILNEEMNNSLNAAIVRTLKDSVARLERRWELIARIDKDVPAPSASGGFDIQHEKDRVYISVTPIIAAPKTATSLLDNAIKVAPRRGFLLMVQNILSGATTADGLRRVVSSDNDTSDKLGGIAETMVGAYLGKGQLRDGVRELHRTVVRNGPLNNAMDPTQWQNMVTSLRNQIGLERT